MHRAHFAHEPRAEILADPVGLNQRPPESLHILRIVGGVPVILFERDGIRYLDRLDSGRFALV